MEENAPISEYITMIVFFPLLIVMGAHVFYLTYYLHEFTKVKYWFSICFLSILEFSLMLYLTDVELSKFDLVLAASIISLFSILPVLIFRGYKALGDGFNCEYYSMGRIFYINILLLLF